MPIFLPRFKDDSLRRARGLPSAQDRLRDLQNPANIPSWAMPDRSKIGSMSLGQQDALWTQWEPWRQSQGARSTQPSAGQGQTSYGQNYQQSPLGMPERSQPQNPAQKMKLPRFHRNGQAMSGGYGGRNGLGHSGFSPSFTYKTY